MVLGKEKLKEVMDWVLDLGITHLTVYALSTENIKGRTEEELETLYDLYVKGLNEIAEDPRIHSSKVRVRAAGRIDDLPVRVREAVAYAEEKTADYNDFTFTVCLAYGGREEIVDARHLVPTLDEPLAQVRAQEARPAGDQYPVSNVRHGW